MYCIYLLILVVGLFDQLPLQFSKSPFCELGIFISDNSSKWTLCPLTNFVIIITAYKCRIPIYECYDIFIIILSLFSLKQIAEIGIIL